MKNSQYSDLNKLNPYFFHSQQFWRKVSPGIGFSGSMMLGAPNLQLSWPIHGLQDGCSYSRHHIHINSGEREERRDPRMLHIFYKERQSISYAQQMSPCLSLAEPQSLNNLSTLCIKDGDQSRSLEISVGLDKPHPIFWALHKHPWVLCDQWEMKPRNDNFPPPNGLEWI